MGLLIPVSKPGICPTSSRIFNILVSGVRGSNSTTYCNYVGLIIVGQIREMDVIIIWEAV